MSKIGIMGGTFNPIHLGHIMLAKAGYQQFQLDKVLVIPNKLPAYKDTDELLDSKHRSRMVQIAIQDYPYMEFSDMELRRTGATYTIDTLRELSGLYPNDQFYFILGGDSLVHLREWREYQIKHIHTDIFADAIHNNTQSSLRNTVIPWEPSLALRAFTLCRACGDETVCVAARYLTLRIGGYRAE